MSEFSNRIEAQRRVLRSVNARPWRNEELFGLSRKAIDRWTMANSLDPQSPIVALVEKASAKLFFLANRSQEQISDEYQLTATEIERIAKAIEFELR